MNPFAGAFEIFKLFKKHLGRRMYVVLLLTVLSALTEGFGISLAMPLLGTLDVGGGAGQQVPKLFKVVFDALGVSGSMVGVLILIACAFILKGLIQFGTSVYNAILQANLFRKLKGKLFDAYSEMSYSYYVSRDAGHFINVINAQVNSFYQSFASYMSFLMHMINALIYLGVALCISWQFGLMAIAAGMILLPLFKGLNRYVKDLSKKSAKEGSVLNKQLVQTLHAFKYVISTCQGSRTRKAIMSSIHRMTGYRVRQGIWAGFTKAVSEPLSVLMIIGILIVQVSVMNQPLAPILVSMVLFHRGMNAMLWIQSGWQMTLSTIGSVEMVEEELNQLAINRERSGNVALGVLDRGIEFQDVCFSYGEDNEVIRRVSLSIPVRSTVAFVGESGAGKSTMVDLLTLLLKPTSGSVVIDGVPGGEVDLKSWRSQIGYVSQETVIFDDTIAANIALEDIDAESDLEKLEKVKEAARNAHVAHFIEELPDGYQTVVGDRGVRLSGGQRQRLFIARELFKRPSLLILDEATSALDSESERAIQDSIDALRGEMTVVIIAHRLSTIRNVDRVFVFDRGEVVEEGSYDMLRECPESRFGAMIQLQAL